jgi:hypothetical protein
MNGFLAIYTSDPMLVCCELDRVRAQVPWDTDSLPLGIGAYQDAVVLQRCYGVGASRQDAWEVPDSEAVIITAGPLEEGKSLEENMPPFRFRQWLFSLVGEVAQADRVRDRLVAELPDFLQRSVRGSTLGEVVFGLFLSELRALGRIEDATLEAPLAAQLLAKAARVVEQVSAEVGGTARPSFAMVATNGRLLAAARRGARPLSFRLLEGDPTCARCGLDATARENDPLVRDHRRRRSVVLSALAQVEGWVPVPDGAAVAIDRKLALQLLPAVDR